MTPVASNLLFWIITQQLADLILGSGIIKRVVAAIKRWDEKEFKPGTPVDDQNAQKRAGVLSEIFNWGNDPNDPCPPLSESWRRLVLELGIRLFKLSETDGKTP